MADTDDYAPVEDLDEEDLYADRETTNEYEESPEEQLEDDEISANEEGFWRGFDQERDEAWERDEAEESY